MCGRYLFTDGKNQRINDLVKAAEEKLPEDLFSQVSLGEVFPGSISFSGIFDRDKQITVNRLMRWGFEKADGRRIINARSETCFTSACFKDCKPCALMASAYYEWSSNKTRYAFYTDEEIFYLAGICRKTKDGYQYVILTEEANGANAEIHPRQPVIFDYETAKKWCASDTPWKLLNQSVQTRYADAA